MAKTPSKKLYDLIHSLSSQEKRYLKIIAKNKGELNNKYIRLFELIEQSEIFDEDTYRRTLYPNLPLNSKKYSELKSYLFQFVLRCLRDFDESHSIDSTIKNGLLNVRVLFNRSKFKYAFIEINKLLKLTYRYEKFKWTLDLLEWKKRIAYVSSDISFFDKNLETIQAEEKEVMGQLYNYKTYEQLFYQLYLFLRKKPSHKKDELKDFIADEVLKAPAHALSFRGLVYYYRIWSIYYFSIGAFQQFAYENEKLIRHIESRLYFFKEDISHYIASLSNHCVAGFLVEDYALLNTSLEKLQNLKPITLDDRIRINRQYYSSKFKLCILSGDFDEGLQIFSTFDRIIPEEHRHIFSNSSFLFQYFYLFFGVGDYEKALDYLNKWINMPRHAERQDMQAVARILLLLIHFEMGNTLLLTSMIRSSKRYLNLKQRSAVLEGLFLPAMREVLKVPVGKEQEEIFQKLLADIRQLPQGANPLFDIFDFEAWVESQVSEQCFADIIRKKFENKNNQF